MNNFKKSVSILLSILMFISAFSSISLTVNGAGSFESEPNNDYKSANVLNSNGTLGATMGSSSDVDYFRINAPSDGEINLSFNHRYIDNSYVYWNIEIIFYSNGTYTTLSDKKVYGYDNEVIALPTVGAVSQGVYYIKISTNWNDTVGQEYSLSCSFTSTEYVEKEVNNSYYDATNCQLNKNYTGCMNSNDDEDFYKFTAGNDGRLKLNFTHQYIDNSYVYWDIEIIFYSNGTYTTLSGKKVYGYDNEVIALPTVGAVSQGVYYIKISTNWNDTVGHKYTIANSFETTNYSEKELNDSFYTANVCTIGNKYVGNMGSSKDVDYYKITPSKSGKLKLLFTHDNYNDNHYIYWDICIYRYSNGEYTSLTEKKIYGYDSETSELPPVGVVASGIYYAKISTYWNDTAGKDYTIQFVQPKSLSSAKVSAIATQTFKGKNITPSVTVKYGSSVLKKGTDYTVEYSNNYYVGTATVTITGKGNYTGTITKSFKIIPKSVNLKSVTNIKKKSMLVKWSKNSNASGYQVVYSTKRNFKKSKSSLISSSYYNKLTITRLAKHKTYYVKVRAYNWSNGKRVYSKFSAVKSKKITK